MTGKIPFNSPHLTGDEIKYIIDAHTEGQLAGDGKYTKLCSTFIQKFLGVRDSLITHSCTAALEMSALLLDIKEGDEVIMPSYTFVSTANAFVLRGATPVFVDVDKTTFNIIPSLVAQAITRSTKAIVVVHYAGVCCNLDEIQKIGSQHGIPIIEDAAQAYMSQYNGKYLGSFGTFSAISFHETKNIISGEGGTLIVNDSSYSRQAEIIREKGTNRSQFFRGEIDKYTWVEKGSSYLPGELICAFLYAQLQNSVAIIEQRLKIWNEYFLGLANLEHEGFLTRQTIPTYCKHNAHMFFVVLQSEQTRSDLIRHLKSEGIHSVFHYVPLHSSPAGIKYGRAFGEFEGTEIASKCLLRLPMGFNVDTSRVIASITKYFDNAR